MTELPKLLTIAIPTWNRARYLEIALSQLTREKHNLTEVEILVSDNASTDDTSDVVSQAVATGLAIRYLRNEKNIGSDRNIAQAFNESSGQYVVIMGDDDVLVDGILAQLIYHLTVEKPSVVFLRSYGFNSDFKTESPGSKGEWLSYKSAEAFLLRAGAQITLISACVVNKKLISPIDANHFVGCSLVQVHLVLLALLKGDSSLSYEGYSVACKRNNSGGYSYGQVFVENLGSILDYYIKYGLSEKVIYRFEGKLIKSHHPYYVWRDIKNRKKNSQYFENRFAKRWDYILFIKPMFGLAWPFSYLWGIIFIIFGRLIFGGDLRRSIFFIFSFMRAKINLFRILN